MAMVGRNAAVGEVDQGRHELTGPVAFAAWFGVHAMLLDTTRAEIEAIIEWTREYFHLEYSVPILDQPEQAGLNLTESGSKTRSGSVSRDASSPNCLRAFKSALINRKTRKGRPEDWR